ncbi:sulfurtransferase complex subunit TusB [Thalassotalea sp. ND16A]|uniref:sulfurtransferase complex subunit TusB n=1 Tax=Thalassotalea sp. ND16A TaxID=1535422 RepID=UPI00051A4674|nr:sulfurtransferase complex subunit TusB [Thalassotalea sp. ND16A]KGJ98713.1 hypothetical protein ND16A_0040 [Thalassotalea sp. ND16A]
MTILHIVRTSAFNDNKLDLCLRIVTEQDSIFLIDDGVYNIAHPKLLQQLDTIEIFALTEHLDARALKVTNSKIKTADFSTLVSLTNLAEKTITWQ